MTEGTAAGLHPDPSGRHQQRYFDGTAWTDHVATNGLVSQESAAVSSSFPWIPVITSTRCHMGTRAVSGSVEDQRPASTVRSTGDAHGFEKCVPHLARGGWL